MYQGTTAAGNENAATSRKTRLQSKPGFRKTFRLSPLAYTFSLILLSGGAQAAGPRPFSGDWFAVKGATRAATAASARSGGLPGMTPTLAQQQQANAQLARSIANLGQTAAAIAAQQAQQAAARQAALNAPGGVPDGLVSGGLQVDNNPATRGWSNAEAPSQSGANGHTTVSINQTQDKAILNWETFNVGKNTEVDFHQQANWAVLNRVNDPQARPSQIQGQIKGDGTVMLVNRNGVIFSGTSQVDTRNLVVAAANIADSQFNTGGLYVDTTATQATFTDAFGKVQVQSGARLQTATPGVSTESGGYVLLLGGEVENAGNIITPRGQTSLAAGDSFFIREGNGTNGNATATTRGNEVATAWNVSGGNSGAVINSGLIQSATGDISMIGHDVRQNGVVLATTSVATRGTVHLLNSAADTNGSVTLGQGSTTAVLLDNTSTVALDAQRDAGLPVNDSIGNLLGGHFDNLSAVIDTPGQSRVEIVSGGNVDFQSGSITLATGGQVAVTAGKRSLVRDGSIIDVSGAVGVQVAMEANSVLVNVQGNEQRDASVNRDDASLNNSSVWVDTRELVFVPAGTNGYATDRWYTAGGLLEVSGYLGTRGHSVGEWMAQGGTVTVTGSDLVTRSGSNINLSGGTLDVQTGYINLSWLKGSDGRLYEVSTAPGDLLYAGLYRGFESDHLRWGKENTAYFYNPLIAPRRRLENGYTVGRDAGKLVIGTRNAVLEGEQIGATFQGDRQTAAPQATLDGYSQSQTAVARGAQLIVGDYRPYFDSASGTFNSTLNANANTLQHVVVGQNQQDIADSLDLTTVLPTDRQGTLYLDSDRVNGYQLGSLKLAANQSVLVNGDLQVQAGGEIGLYGPQVDIQANLTSHAGSIALGNVIDQFAGTVIQPVQIGSRTGPIAVTVADGVQLDARGIWSNLQSTLDDAAGLAHIKGGRVAIRNTGDITLDAGSLITVDAGAARLADGTLRGGAGGDVTLATLNLAGATGQLDLAGAIHGYGFAGNGTLTLEGDKVLIGAPTQPLDKGVLNISEDFFDKGFAHYQVIGNRGLTVADGTQVDAQVPVYRFNDTGLQSASGEQPADLLALWTPPQYQEDPVHGILTRREGASLTLQAGTTSSTDHDATLSIGQGAHIGVDDGQSITVLSRGSIDIDGQLTAHGGTISVNVLMPALDPGKPLINQSQNSSTSHDRTLRLGSNAVLDVSGTAHSAIDARGRRYGMVDDGGTILVGSALSLDQGAALAPDLFVVLEKGSLLEASGSQATFDLPGQGTTLVASQGGNITLSSAVGLYLDGDLHAAAGGAGAAGGSLSVGLESDLYALGDTVALRARELVLSQTRQPETDLAGGLLYGHGNLSVEQIEDGGFANLALLSRGMITFDGDLSLGLSQSLSLYSGGLGLAAGTALDARVNLAAPYVLLAGLGNFASSDSQHGFGGGGGGISTQVTQAQLNVNAGLIDVRDHVSFGDGGTKASLGSAPAIDRAGFADIELHSQGDLRFLHSVNPDGGGASTQLITTGDLKLIAAQLYPATQASAEARAAHLTVGRNSDVDPAVPFSVFGSLMLTGTTVDQGGVVRAPLGNLEIGGTSLGAAPSTQVNLLPGSLTSISGAGLVMPYGGTVDGLTYNYNGTSLSDTLLAANSPMRSNVSLSGQSIDVQSGAVLDLSGGGDIRGGGFVSGRGGSTDARNYPLVQIGENSGFVLPGLSSNPVYAIIPGVQVGAAPIAAESGAGTPRVGQQITLEVGVPGLPAGVYTLLPSTYALLPGAYRVELNGLAAKGSTQVATAMRNGSWTVSGKTSVVGTHIQDSVSSQFILTSADTLRHYSQYNETSLAQFLIADAARLGVPRSTLPADAGRLTLNLSTNRTDRPSFTFDGIGRYAAAEGGFGSIAAVLAHAPLEILADGAAPTAGFDGVSISGSALNDIGASSLRIGSAGSRAYGQGGNFISLANSGIDTIVLRSGAVLSAPEVLLVTGTVTGGIVIEQGASINTLGRGAPAYDSLDGFIYNPGQSSVLAVSNGWLDMLAPTAATPTNPNRGPGQILIGTCLLTCTGQTQLYSEGTIVAATDNTFELDSDVRFGTRNLTLAVGTINAGSVTDLAAVSANNLLPKGLTLNQDVLDRLLRGDPEHAAPALETLTLTASQALNFYGSVALDTLDPVTGKSLMANLILGTPAIYGYGTADDVASIRTGNLIWNGALTAPGNVVTGGAGTGSGRLSLQAERIELGYGPRSQPTDQSSFDRLILGFANVELAASDRLTANHQGGLTVYQSQGDYVAGKGYTYSGGNLSILTPLVTGEAGSISRITVGGALNLAAPTGSTAGAVTLSNEALGAELDFSAGSIDLNTAVVLPSGKLTLSSTDDLTLGDAARIDMAGRTVTFNDIDKYSWGGDLNLQSLKGDIRQAAGSRIDLSATNNYAGHLSAVALDAAAGVVSLQGQIVAGSSGYYDAGGTLVPYASGAISIQAQRLGDDGTQSSQFAALNQRLNAGQVFGTRSFQLKQGDLTIGDDVKANQVEVSVDGGLLSVNGLIDASGERVGSIRLAGKQGLTLGNGAVLDAHGSVLRVDSYGLIIDSPNRAVVELNSGDGTLTLASGSRIDLRHGTNVAGDGQARGTLELNAPRLGGDNLGDIDIDAQRGLTIQGAKSIALNAVRRYTDAPDGTDPAASGRPYQVIDQAYLDAKNADSLVFMGAALNNSALLNGKLAGLTDVAYTDTFHLRPGVEIVSKTADGDLIVRGDLDLSGYRYASLNPNNQQTLVYGSGEPGSLVIRAGGNLDIYGSISDGFAPPPDTQDDNGWLLTEGPQLFGGDVVVPGSGITLFDGTAFPAGRVLNYDLPIQGKTLAAGTVLPVNAPLAQSITLPVGTVLSGAILNPDSSVAVAAGTMLTQPLTLGAGMLLGAGFRLVDGTSIGAVTWPHGVPLPSAAVVQSGPDMVLLAGNLALQMGALIPSTTDVKLGGVDSVELRVPGTFGQGRNWAVAPLLPEGSQSWSLRLVAGADTSAADTRATNPYSTGELRLADTHYGMKAVPKSGGFVWTADGVAGWGDPSVNVGDPLDPIALGWATICDDNPTWCAPAGTDYGLEPANSRVSVVRTGTGDLDLLAGGAISMNSLYGVYTAGTASPVAAAYNQPRGRGADGKVLSDSLGGYEDLVDGSSTSLYQAWYPEDGGNLLLKAGGNLTGDALSRTIISGPTKQLASDSVGNWLWRQGSGQALAEADTLPTAWWINFGTYVDSSGSTLQAAFTGFGTLGGGNLDVKVGGDAGTITALGDSVGGTASAKAPRSQGLILAVGSTGRVGTDGKLMLTGGGDLSLQVGGGVNPTLSARNPRAGYSPDSNLAPPVHDLQGTLVNLRGTIQVQAGAIGGIGEVYGPDKGNNDPTESRAFDPYKATSASATGGLVVIPGDATASLSTRGDLVLGGAADPGRVPLVSTSPFTAQGIDYSEGGSTWFSLWTANTAIDLFSAGGNLTPSTLAGEIGTSSSSLPLTGLDTSPTDGRFVYPSILRAVAASGSLYYGASALSSGGFTGAVANSYPLLLAPSAHGELQFLAQDSIYAGGYTVTQSGAAASALASPFAPGFLGEVPVLNGINLQIVTTQREDGIKSASSNGRFSLFAFGGDTASASRGAVDPARFYAVNGDLVGITSGAVINFADTRGGATWYEGGAPVWMMAGRDIVNSGLSSGGAAELNNGVGFNSSPAGNLFVHDDPTDISLVSAGRDIIYSSFNIAGPGTLVVSAGRDIRMEDKASITSLGAVAPNDTRPGASLLLQAGASGADFSGFAERYLNPENLAISGTPLADQPGKVVKTYDSELSQWLLLRYGFNGDAEQCRAYFAALPVLEQGLFARQVYFAELKAGGIEYNEVDGPRQGSYLRGREAIAALFPDKDVAGNIINYKGDVILYGTSGIHTNFGGDIQILTPGGQQVFGIEGTAPPSTAGVVTQGSGNIQLYAKDSILLGQSRILTTFGGSILGWSAEGDINAGRGSKTTVVFTPPKRTYDNWGNVTLSPQVPSTGAGIATLNPIPEVPPGDIDLIAPLGTIDAGEAGIRVSGNVNIAALHVVNAANIQVQGKSTGVPVVGAVNTGALTSASQAAGSAVQAAEQISRQAQRNQPSIINVEILGYGNERLAASGVSAPTAAAGADAAASGYDAHSPLKVLGLGKLDATQLNQLTAQEKNNLL
ncbi:filamentous haemagglutinin family protein [Sodalis ligni]|uniref:Filamentous hemagglutinin family protein n=1 Tax=Sodalis ligni TaxID=2697027 RepID=A0A4V2Q394_9GAMM|nr:filamentous haemagglutinin family protein [Sodalis ligni]TCL05858.1 filamentous hemagglutinin family protein [Sodalis ligni]